MDSDGRNEISLSRRVRRLLLCWMLVGAFLSPSAIVWGAGPRDGEVQPPRAYNSSEAGHPIKILYYAVYPAGFLLNALVLKPVWWLGQRQPFRTFFGVDVVRFGH